MNTSVSIIRTQRTRQLPTLLLLAAGIMALATASVSEAGVAKSVSKNTGTIQQGKEQNKELIEKWGIELLSMRSTAFGHMLDFRYRVLDAEKAAPLFERKVKPYLIHQGSGKALAVPNTNKLGSLRNSNTPQQGRTYWMFFGNSHGVVKKGDLVTVAIGDFQAKDIKVE